MTESYPLQWPAGKKRIFYPKASKFGRRSLDVVTKILLKEIKLLKGTLVVISTDLRLRNDGLPYSNQAQPKDKGASIYFTHNGKQMCFACDRWDRIEDNIYAVAMTVGALRGIERWGSGDMVQQAFTGFQAIPDMRNNCYSTLGVPATSNANDIMEAFRARAKLWHPDVRGGSVEQFNQLSEARDEALRRLS